MITARLDEPYRRYLRLLGIDSAEVSLPGLRQIVSRHLYRIPFENVSKLILFGREGAGRFLTLTEFLDGIEHSDLGGTCHSCNPFLADLLCALGYHAELLAADMSRPNVHTCVRVRIDGADYHVDVGYGAPFREPMPLNRLPYEIVEGFDRYLFERSPDGNGHAMTAFSRNERGPGYIVRPSPRTRQFFQPVMSDSFHPTATFLNHLRICRIFERYSVTLFDHVLSVHHGAQTINTELTTPFELATAIAEYLAMPRCPWRAAVQVLERVTGRPFFEALAAGAVH